MLKKLKNKNNKDFISNLYIDERGNIDYLNFKIIK